MMSRTYRNSLLGYLDQKDAVPSVIAIPCGHSAKAIRRRGPGDGPAGGAPHRLKLPNPLPVLRAGWGSGTRSVLPGLWAPAASSCGWMVWTIQGSERPGGIFWGGTSTPPDDDTSEMNARAMTAHSCRRSSIPCHGSRKALAHAVFELLAS